MVNAALAGGLTAIRRRQEITFVNKVMIHELWNEDFQVGAGLSHDARRLAGPTRGYSSWLNSEYGENAAHTSASFRESQEFFR